ncbi:MAG: hypothetical protein ABGZ17_31070, partial [Planctomycetaceae bacterium]
MSKPPATDHPQPDDLRTACPGSWIGVAALMLCVLCVVGCQLVDSAAVRSVVSVTSDREHRVPADASAEHSGSIVVGQQSAEPVSHEPVSRDVAAQGAELSTSAEIPPSVSPIELTLNIALQFALDNNSQIGVLS